MGNKNTIYKSKEDKEEKEDKKESEEKSCIRVETESPSKCIANNWIYNRLRNLYAISLLTNGMQNHNYLNQYLPYYSRVNPSLVYASPAASLAASYNTLAPLPYQANNLAELNALGYDIPVSVLRKCQNRTIKEIELQNNVVIKFDKPY